MPSHPPRRARISDVAQHAGVSVGTVSNVLNRPDKVGTATVERVRESIRVLGFTRNANASILAAGTNRSIGLVVIDLGNSMFVDAARGAQAAARSAGLNVLVAGSEDDFELQRANVDFFDEARVAGLVLAPMQDSTEHIRRLAEHGRPTVLLNYEPTDSRVCSVVIDNEQVGYLAGRHMIGLGCERVVFIGADDELQPVRLRREGVRRALAEAPRVRFEELQAPSLARESGAEVAGELLARGPRTRPDGVIAVTDMLAAGAIERLGGAGIRVPDDIAVMGCDHNTAAWGGPVPLTTITMRGDELGAAAVRLLLDEVENGVSGHAHQRIVLAPQLVERQSTVGTTDRADERRRHASA